MHWFPIQFRHLVGLWPEGSEDLYPQLSVEIDSGLGRGHPRVVTVVGRAQPGSHVVLRVGGDTIWTTGPVKDRIDLKAKPMTPG